MTKSDGRRVPDHLPDQIDADEVLGLLNKAEDMVDGAKELVVQARNIMASAVMRRREELGRRNDPTGEIQIAEKILEDIFAGR